MKAELIPHQACQAALGLFLQKGFEDTSMSDIAQQAGLSEAEVYTHFGNKQDILLFLYKSINTDWQLYINELPAKKLSERFELALAYKVELMAPYTAVFANMMGDLLNHSRIGIRAPRTAHIRTMGLHAMQQLVNGASDSSRLKQKVEDLPSLLYVMHWALLFLHVQSDNKNKTLQTVGLMARMLQQANKLSFLPGAFPFINDIGAWAGGLLNEPGTATNKPDRRILKALFNYRKTTQAEPACLENNCETCFALHEAQVSYFTSQNLPVHFILPAFPAKSPNRGKVLGALPDLGEEIALKTLQDICDEIKTVYAPGAHITICSDGRIFSDLVDVSDEDVSAYVRGIKEIIGRLGLINISIVNLEDLVQDTGFDECRSRVISAYAEPIELLQEKVKQSTEFRDLFNGIHRFITEDRKVLYPDRSLSNIKESSKPIALGVIQRSNAWTRFLAYIFPDALRLSIHPYPAHYPKTGIRLTRAKDNWLTPWHGVVVLQHDGYMLMKKQEAEQAGAKLVEENGRPHYYTLIDK